VAANLSIQQVSTLEQQLAADHPHMNTVYRLFAVLVLPDLTQGLTKTALEHSPLARNFKEADAIEYLGDCLECGFRSPSDPVNRHQTISAELFKKWQLPEVNLSGFEAEQIKQLVIFEVPLKQEKVMSRRCMELASSFGLKSGSWLPKAAFTGGSDRPIAHTIRLLQGLFLWASLG